MNIIITGATGFVGSNLQKSLKSSHKIELMSVRYKADQEFKINSDCVIHLAGKAHDLKNVSQPKDYYEANFELTKQLFDAFLVSDASIFIFMSTVKAVADKIDYVLTEDEVCNPKTHYGISKYKAEQYILNSAIPEEKRIYILRPSMIHGPGNKGNLNLLYKLVAKGIPWPLGAFENKRSFLTVENLSFVIKELLNNEKILSGIYQVADDNYLSTNDLISLLAKSLDKKGKILSIPTGPIKSVAKIGDYLHLPLNSERLQKLTENYMVSNKKIVKAMNKKLPIDASEGLLTTFKSFNDKID